MREIWIKVIHAWAGQTYLRLKMNLILRLHLIIKKSEEQGLLFMAPVALVSQPLWS